MGQNLFKIEICDDFSIYTTFTHRYLRLPFFHFTKNGNKCTKNRHFFSKYFTKSVLNLIQHNLTKPNLTLPKLQAMSLLLSYLKPKTATYSPKTYQLFWYSATIAIINRRRETSIAHLRPLKVTQTLTYIFPVLQKNKWKYNAGNMKQSPYAMYVM